MRLKSSLWIFIVFIIVAPVVSAVSINGNYQKEIMFEPKQNYTFSFSIGGAEHLESFIEGYLARYAVLIDPNQNGSGRIVMVKLFLPSQMDPGEYDLFFGVREPPPPGMVVARASVRVRIRVIVLSDEKTIRYTLLASNAPPGGDVHVVFRTKSLTKKDIDIIIGHYNITTLDGALITQGKTKATYLLSSQTKDIDGTTSVAGLSPGRYKVVGYLVYDGKKTPVKETTFKIGTMKLFLKDYTKKLYKGEVNKFNIILTSDWVYEIKGIYAKIIFNGKESETPTKSLNPDKEITLTSYVEVPEDFEEGKHNLTVTVYYQDKTMNLELPVNITTPPVKDKEENKKVVNTTPLYIYAALIILVILNGAILLFFLLKEHKKK